MGNSQEYQKQINKVLNYILKHSKDDLPLDKLAEVANYSPFHFQKIFKEVMGESPKQYIIRVKIETAAHFLYMHKTKSVSEIAIDFGFSSPSAFARSFKKYFGLSAEEFRCIPEKEHVKLFKSEGFHKELLNSANSIEVLDSKKETVEIIVKKINSIHGIFTNAPFGKVEDIINSFRKTIQLAETNDIEIGN